MKNGQQNQNANLFKYPAKAPTGLGKRSHQEMNGSIGGLPNQAQKVVDGPAKLAKATDQAGVPLSDGRKLLSQKPMPLERDCLELGHPRLGKRV